MIFQDASQQWNLTGPFLTEGDLLAQLVILSESPMTENESLLLNLLSLRQKKDPLLNKRKRKKKKSRRKGKSDQVNVLRSLSKSQILLVIRK